MPPRKALRFVSIQVTGRLSRSLASVSGPEHAGQFLADLIGTYDREYFLTLHLNGKNGVRSVETISIGTLNSALIHPREVFKGALLANAHAIICGHNHPSGDLTPSSEDEQIMKRLKDAGELLGVALIDFLIVSGDRYRSMMF